jgi:hypothetical protein
MMIEPARFSLYEEKEAENLIPSTSLQKPSTRPWFCQPQPADKLLSFGPFQQFYMNTSTK